MWRCYEVMVVNTNCDISEEYRTISVDDHYHIFGYLPCDSRDEEKLVAKQQGVDGPLVVKFFNDPQIKSLRSKHQRSATFPLSPVFNKLPPSLVSPNSTGQLVHEAKLIGDGPTVFVLLLPDGTGYCKYP